MQLRAFLAAALTALTVQLGRAARDTQTFALLQFNGGEIFRGRLDPIVSPGRVSEHVHGVVGGSGFAADATGESLARSSCTSAKAADDKSAYWFPWLYFNDPATGKFESVEISYVNVYYFFEPTDDRITAFPQGLQIVSGDASTRVAPWTRGRLNLDPDKGDIQPQPPRRVPDEHGFSEVEDEEADVEKPKKSKKSPKKQSKKQRDNTDKDASSTADDEEVSDIILAENEFQNMTMKTTETSAAASEDLKKEKRDLDQEAPPTKIETPVPGHKELDWLVKTKDAVAATATSTPTLTFQLPSYSPRRPKWIPTTW